MVSFNLMIGLLLLRVVDGKTVSFCQMSFEMYCYSCFAVGM